MPGASDAEIDSDAAPALFDRPIRCPLPLYSDKSMSLCSPLSPTVTEALAVSVNFMTSLVSNPPTAPAYWFDPVMTPRSNADAKVEPASAARYSAAEASACAAAVVSANLSALVVVAISGQHQPAIEFLERSHESPPRRPCGAPVRLSMTGKLLMPRSCGSQRVAASFGSAVLAAAVLLLLAARRLGKQNGAHAGCRVFAGVPPLADWPVPLAA